jgi:hypothetical protein
MRVRILIFTALLLLSGAGVLPVFGQAGWTPVSPGGDTLCARGAPYTFFTRAGDPDKLLIFFQGGGACWNAETCDPNVGLFDDVVLSDEINAYSTGIFNPAAGAENPLASYSAVFVPYCTGDWHTGSSSVSYGDQTIHHNGYANASAALDWAFANYPAPREVVVSGCSAGSYASIFYTPTIARRYSRSNIVQVGDAGAGQVVPGWGGFDVWGTFAHLPRGVRRTTPELFVESLYRAAARSYPRVQLAQYNSFNDNVQVRYFEIMGGWLADWVIGLENTIAALSNLANFHAYTAAGGEHCITTSDRFYSEAVDGIRFRDWLAALIAGEDVPDVHCSTC